jgi:hypothetical protein
MDVHKYIQKLVPVYSVEFGYVPTNVESPKVIYVTTRWPHEIAFGTRVRFHSLSPEMRVPRETFEVREVNGMRISLVNDGYGDLVLPPSSLALGLKTWGYTTREPNSPPGYMKNWIYGRGDPQVFLLYEDRY